MIVTHMHTRFSRMDSNVQSGREIDRAGPDTLSSTGWAAERPSFRMIGNGSRPATGMDLRLLGWALDASGETGRTSIGLFDATGLGGPALLDRIASIPEAERSRVMVLGVCSSSQRAVLIGMGFGDAMSSETSLDEIGVRARRLFDCCGYLPQFRRFGGLRLDLLAREASFDGKPINLNPREFTLLWRLADCPDRTVSKKDLIRDVWNMGFVPETNSIAVHMSRLRRKLSFVGLPRIIETCSSGGYRLCLRGLAENRLNGAPTA